MPNPGKRQTSSEGTYSLLSIIVKEHLDDGLAVQYSTVQYPQVKVSGQNGKRHKTRPVCPISLQIFLLRVGLSLGMMPTKFCLVWTRTLYLRAFIMDRIQTVLYSYAIKSR